MLAIVKQQVVTATADLADGSLGDSVGPEPTTIIDHVDPIATSASDGVKRSSSNFKLVVATARSCDAAAPIGKVDDAAVTEIDAVMLKGNTFVVSPNKKVVSACQPASLQKSPVN